MPARSIGSGNWPAALCGLVGAQAGLDRRGQLRSVAGRSRACVERKRRCNSGAAGRRQPGRPRRRSVVGMGTPRTNEALLASGQAAPAPVSRRRGQTRSLSVDRKSRVRRRLRLRCRSDRDGAGRIGVEFQGKLEHLDDHRQRGRRQLDGLERLARVGSNAMAEGRLLYVHALAGHAGGHHVGHGLRRSSAPGRGNSPSPAARSAATGPRRSGGHAAAGDGGEAWAWAVLQASWVWPRAR